MCQPAFLPIDIDVRDVELQPDGRIDIAGGLDGNSSWRN